MLKREEVETLIKDLEIAEVDAAKARRHADDAENHAQQAKEHADACQGRIYNIYAKLRPLLKPELAPASVRRKMVWLCCSNPQCSPTWSHEMSGTEEHGWFEPDPTDTDAEPA